MLDKIMERMLDTRPMRMAGQIFGEEGPYRKGRSMGFAFLHEDMFGPDNHYDTVDPITHSTSQVDGSYFGIE